MVSLCSCGAEFTCRGETADGSPQVTLDDNHEIRVGGHAYK